MRLRERILRWIAGQDPERATRPDDRIKASGLWSFGMRNEAQGGEVDDLGPRADVPGVRMTPTDPPRPREGPKEPVRRDPPPDPARAPVDPGAPVGVELPGAPTRGPVEAPDEPALAPEAPERKVARRAA
jgi:hypothetical protein